MLVVAAAAIVMMIVMALTVIVAAAAILMTATATAVGVRKFDDEFSIVLTGIEESIGKIVVILLADGNPETVDIDHSHVLGFFVLHHSDRKNRTLLASVFKSDVDKVKVIGGQMVLEDGFSCRCEFHVRFPQLSA